MALNKGHEMKTLNLLTFANGFDNTRRVYEIGVELPTAEVTGQIVVALGGRSDAIGFACYDCAVIAQPDKDPVMVQMYVMLLSKTFAQDKDKNYATTALNASLSALKMRHVEKHDDVPLFVLEAMRDNAVSAAVQIMREQMMQEAMQQQAMKQGVAGGVVAPERKLVLPG